ILEMQSRNGKPLAEKEALILKADVSYEIGVEQAITIPFQFRLMPFEKHPIGKAARPKTIDGQLKDWGKDQINRVLQSEDPADLSIRYGLQYDEDFLYFAAEVQDSDLNVDTTLAIYRQDGIGLIINGALLRESVQAKGEGWYEQEAMLRISPATADLPSVEYLSEGWPAGTQYVCRAVEGGYQLEVAFPISYFNDRQADNWKTARINIVLQDYDSKFTEGKRLFVFPDWRYGDNVPGSGMFFKE
ncbi:MAG: hypothetical protein KDC44_23410, partial [Phaeodactylibacter sp.]|nr:hypothetical protein [Phaeodactylibacter sp.]